jgi:glycosyltransferase involved in cell wall biosynthesis
VTAPDDRRDGQNRPHRGSTIALLVPGPPCTTSGGYIYDCRLVEGLRALGHEVRVVELAGRHPLPDEAAEAAARAALAALPQDTRLVIDGLGLPAFAPLARELVVRRAAALIHHPTALEPGFAEAEREQLRARETMLFRGMARIIATHQYTARRLTDEFGVPAERIGVVEPGTDPAPRAKGSGGPKGGTGVAVLSVGALVPRKGHDVLMRSLAGVLDVDWTLTIAGPERDKVHAHGLRALAEELGIARRVTFAGEVSPAELEALYARSDLFALATFWEGYGMAAAEALARGLPVAVTAGGAIAEVVPVEAGIVSPPGDVISFTKGLRRVLFDANLRAAMAEAAWEAGQKLPRWEDRAALFAQELEQA